MWRLFLLFVVLFFCVVGVGARALGDEEVFVLPKLIACPAADVESGLLAHQAQYWTRCEKWVWSCIVQGREANLYDKKCTIARPDGDPNDKEFRSKNKLAPFFDPDRYKDTNALSAQFIRDLLWVPHYSEKIPPVGIRIFGGYFQRSLNLENVTTTSNLVIDGSIFKRGVRMSNFRTTKNVSFDWSNVSGAMLLMRARIDGSLFMEDGVFDRVDLRDSRIGASLEATGSLFNDNFQFDRAHIDGKAHFVFSRLTALAGRDATVGGTIELRWADVRVSIDFSGTNVNGDVRLQHVTFGRKISNEWPACDWDMRIARDDVLTSSVAAAKKMGRGRARRLLEEIVYDRPMRKGERKRAMCDLDKVNDKKPAPRQVMLRDMRIAGTLCVMDTAGSFPVVSRRGDVLSAAAPVVDNIELISLDGTESSTTLLRWADVQSKEMWRAVNFTTGYLLLRLEPQPELHEFDNWDVSRVAFLRGKEPHAHSSSSAVPGKRGDADSNRGLCEVTSTHESLSQLQDRKTQELIAAFFTGRSNHSGSYQPLANIIQSLENSNVETTFLNIELSTFKHRNRCATSLFSKPRLPWKGAKTPREAPHELLTSWQAGMAGMSWSNLGEVRKLGLDTVCSMWQPISYFTTSYGHEATNLIYFFIAFVFTFGFALKVFDKRALSAMEPGTKLGFLYSFDMFLPVGQLRINSDHENLVPHRRWLRWWLFFHRLAGAIICLAIFLLVFKAF